MRGDAKVMDELIREDDRAVYGNKGYVNDRKKVLARAAGVLWAVKEKAKPGQPLWRRVFDGIWFQIFFRLGHELRAAAARTKIIRMPPVF